MLALKRRKGESIVIGDDVRVTALRFKAEDKLRLEIIAPRALSIVRSEIYKPGVPLTMPGTGKARMTLELRTGESVRIGPEIVVHFCSLHRHVLYAELDEATIGVAAPRSLKIVRQELTAASKPRGAA